MFDVWTFEHLLTGLSIGMAVRLHNRRHFQRLFHSISKFFKNKVSLWKKHRSHKTVLRFDLIVVLFVAYLWEAVEHYMETGLLGGAVEFWFQGVEIWTNRLVADPLMLVFGYMLAVKYPFLVWPARILSLLWLITHIFIFPHSMYLHYLF
ncbi:hypothetical protein GOV09_05935 [Candidatus Woesearchaeota archaeon]|nr:hypothetical protein [Candidatus Woesearchaeota archaeon]